MDLPLQVLPAAKFLLGMTHAIRELYISFLKKIVSFVSDGKVMNILSTLKKLRDWFENKYLHVSMLLFRFY